jgi:hypothetical protein
MNTGSRLSLSNVYQYINHLSHSSPDVLWIQLQTNRSNLDWATGDVSLCPPNSRCYREGRYDRLKPNRILPNIDGRFPRCSDPVVTVAIDSVGKTAVLRTGPSRDASAQCPDRLWDHPASCPVCTMGSFLGGKAAKAWRWPLIHVPRLICGAIHPLPHHLSSTLL